MAIDAEVIMMSLVVSVASAAGDKSGFDAVDSNKDGAITRGEAEKQ